MYLKINKYKKIVQWETESWKPNVENPSRFNSLIHMIYIVNGITKKNNKNKKSMKFT